MDAHPLKRRIKQIMKHLIFTIVITIFLIIVAIINKEDVSGNNETMAISSINYNEVLTVTTPSPSPVPTKNPVKVAKTEIKEIEKKIEKILKTSSSNKASKRLKRLFLNYKKCIKKHDGLIDPPESIYDCFSKEDITYICRTVETETYQQSMIRKANVASTVLSRFEHGAYGNSLKEIVTSPNQFVCGRTDISKETKLAVEIAFMFKTKYDGSLYFQSAGYMKSFSGADYMGFDGCHYFYK